MSTLVSGEGLIDGTDGDYVAGLAVLMEGDRISEIGPAEELEGRASDRLLFEGATLLPGFVDAHSHITIRPGEGDQHGQLRRPAVWQALRGVTNLQRDLASGVTTMRVMGEEHGIDHEFKRAVDAGEVAGPRLLVSGRGLSPSHGHGSSLAGVDGPDDLRKAVRVNISAGADQIKIFATGGVSSRNTPIDASNYTREEIRAVVDEAGRSGRTVAAHAHGGLGVDLCVEEGVHSIEHGALLNGENVKAMGERGTWLVLTNTILFHPEGIERGDATEPSIMAKVESARRAVEGSFELVAAAGLRFAMGTDSMHGLFAYEMCWAVERGVRAEDAIVAATRHGAEVLGLDADIGTLAPGKRADLVVLEGNPVADIEAARRPRAVIKDGRIVAGST